MRRSNTFGTDSTCIFLCVIHCFSFLLQPTVWNYAHPDKISSLQHLLERNPGKWDISSLKIIECVSDILRPETHRFLQEKLGIPIYHEYASTEAGVPFKTDFRSPPVFGSVGKPQRTLKVRKKYSETKNKSQKLNHSIIIEVLSSR